MLVVRTTQVVMIQSEKKWYLPKGLNFQLGMLEKIISSMLTAKANQKYQGTELILINDAAHNIIHEFSKTIS